MRYMALACDYDGTLATDGRVADDVIAALERLRGSGRHLILVTGRDLDDWLRVFPWADLFERIVAENGALLYRPATREEKSLGEPAPPALVEALRAAGVTPLSVGRVIVATWHPNETTVLRVIRDLGLERQVIFNKGAVMVLPSGVTKATGMVTALNELGLSPHNAVGIGDAENDHAFLSACECAVAVANALPALQERADLVTRGDHGAGVIELIDHLLSSDLQDLESRLTRLDLPIGTREDDRDVNMHPYGPGVLITGSSGGGKSTFAMAILEDLAERAYQYCVIDPEGDYTSLNGAIALGDQDRAPLTEEVLDALQPVDQNVVVNLLGIPLEQRPEFFQTLLSRLQELRARTGRPHWILVDEAHHLLPASWDPAVLALPQQPIGMIWVAVRPVTLPVPILSSVDTVIAIGDTAGEAIHSYCDLVHVPHPPFPESSRHLSAAWYWKRDTDEPPVLFQAREPRAERRRHVRKYVEGELGADKSFYFRGPEGKLNLRAQNLALFLQLAEGVDDETWQYHLRRGDYSRWFRESIKDESLATEAAQVENQTDLPAEESRARIRAAVEQRYTTPA